MSRVGYTAAVWHRGPEVRDVGFHEQKSHRAKGRAGRPLHEERDAVLIAEKHLEARKLLPYLVLDAAHRFLIEFGCKGEMEVHAVFRVHDADDPFIG